MLKLYHGKTSVCSQKVRVTLAELGLDYESVLIDLQKGEQFDPAYKRLNPDAVVPTLIDDDLVVVESSLIAEYLDKTRNEGRLIPQDIALETRVRHWLLRCIDVHAAVSTLSFASVVRSKTLASKTPEQIEAGIARMSDPVRRSKRRDLFANGLSSIHVEQALQHLHRAFGDMSAHIGQGDWVSGPDIGLADLAMVSYIDRLERLGFTGLWDEPFPAVGAWLAKMQARPSYSTAIDEFIPESMAQAQRTEGSKHWPELGQQWDAIG